MKKSISVFMCIALLLLMVPLSLGAAAGTTYRFEAENMQKNFVRYPTDAQYTQPVSGESIGVNWANEPATFPAELTDMSFGRLVLEAPADGTYGLGIGYYSGDYPIKVFVNDDEPFDVTLPNNNWFGHVANVDVTLKEGKNVVIIAFNSWGHFDFIDIPSELTVVSTPTAEGEYLAADSRLQATKLLPVSELHNPDAQLYTGTLKWDASTASDPTWEGQATFTIDVSANIESITLNYYVAAYVDGAAKLGMSVNGGSDVILDLSGDQTNTKLTKVIDAATLRDAGLQEGTNTIKFHKVNENDGDVGLYSLQVTEGDAPVEDNYVTKTAAELSDVIRMRGRSLDVGTAKSFDWSASGFEFVFEGSGSITANITANTNTPLVLVVDVNGETHRVTAANGTSNVVLASGLQQGTYTIKVYKTTEAAGSLAQLNSLRYLEGSTLEKTPESNLKFEFLGDSITCGNQIAANTIDGYSAYASILARAYGADWNTISVSGRGLMVGYASEQGWALDRDHEINTLYNYTSWFRDKNAQWDASSYVPDVVIANLGNNDLGPATGITIDEFTAEVKRFTGVLRENYPDAEIIWCYGLFTNRAYAEQYEAAIDELRETDSKVHFLYFPQMGGGDGGHPNYEEHHHAAEMLSELVAELLDVENPMDEYVPPVEPTPEKGGYLDTAGVALPAPEEGWTRYEAEDAVIFGSTKDGSGQDDGPVLGTEQQPFFSGEGHMAAGGFQSNAIGNVYTPEAADFAAGNIGYVKFTVTSDKAGETTMRIGFNGSDPGAAFIVKVNDQENRQITLPNATMGAWNLMGYVEFTVTLQEGENTIYVSRTIYANHTQAEGPWRNIDFIDIQEVGAQPALEMGDVNGDGDINSTDARLILQYTVGYEELTAEQLARADVKPDGSVNSSDARAVLQYTVGLVETLPVA